ncbi:hypothetical protein B0H14DRAFT_2347875 [Mycena olivaceomarginata]|nr:hypothetical protein B0H14DRAFT_2347875 [Mycena olivaceomarginata]
MPSGQQKTIAAISQPRPRNIPAPPRAPLTHDQRKLKTEESAQRQAEIDAAVQGFLDDAFKLANKLAEKYDKKERYFLDLLFQGGARMVHAQDEINPYNAFKKEKAATLREEGTPMNAGKIHKQYYHEYTKLTDDEKEALKKRHEQEKDTTPVRRLTPRARAQDFANTAHNMEKLLSGLALRVGVEGFFVIVRSNTDFNSDPYWFFTSAELRHYMPLAIRKRWDTAEVGVKLEAFSVAGCDAMSEFPHSFEQHLYLIPYRPLAHGSPKVCARQGRDPGQDCADAGYVTNANGYLHFAYTSQWT